MDNLASALGSENIYTVSAKAVSSVLDRRDPDAALLLLYIMRQQEHFDRAEAIRALDMDEARFAAAMEVISSRCEPVPEQLSMTDDLPQRQNTRPSAKADAVRIEEPPSYTRAELAGAMEDRDFAFLCIQSEKAVGHPLRQHEVNSLMMIYDYLGLPANVAALLINHVQRECERRSTPEHVRSVSFRDIRSEAVRWYENGVTTVAAAERYMEEQSRKNSAMGRALRILGISGRNPSPTERRYIDLFLELDPSLELIALAYDLTVTNKGSLVWPYMRGILQRWSEKGYHTSADVESGERQRKNAVYGKPDAPGDDYDERVIDYFRKKRREEE